MPVTYDLFLKWKTLRKINSERKALIELKMSSGAAVHWKNGRNAETYIIEKMANDLGENAAMWAALAMEEQSRGESARSWARIAKQLGSTATAIVMISLACSAFQTSKQQAEPQSTLYTLCKAS